MARTVLEGPILSGDNRFGPQRDVGQTTLVQTAFLNFANTTPGQAGYSGGSGVFVSSNNIPNNVGTIWTAQAGAYSTNGPTVAAAPTADTAGTIYRGAVFLLPQGSSLLNIDFDVTALPSNATTTATAIQPYVSNAFATSTGVYAAVGTVTPGTVATGTFISSATMLSNAESTLQDVQNIQPGQQPTWFSQVVVTLKITNTGLVAPTSGQINVTLKYAQQDMNIGNATTYPYGNFD